MPTILVIDDEPVSLMMLEEHLRQGGFSPLTACCGATGLEILAERAVDLVLTDLFMFDMDGLEVLKRVREGYPEIPVIVMTANVSVKSAVDAMRRGAYDYLEKPFGTEELWMTIQRAFDHQSAVRENEQIKSLFREQFSFQNIVTVNPGMKQQLALAAKVSSVPQTTISIYGESGCGKEVLARAIHFAGKGSPATFVAVNCAAIPEHLLESELFGHVRGAFTGADRDREGKFHQARGGTILLDEIGDMPLPLQAKLLRVLQERVFERIGNNVALPVECRVIVATNHNLGALVASGRFREDLYHRINVFPLHIPPLRERSEDIPLLCEYLLDQLRQQLGKHLPGISRQAMDGILGYHWPGNVRELRNCLERAAILTDGELIRPSHLAFLSTSTPHAPGSGPEVPGTVTYSVTLPLESLSLDSLVSRLMSITLDRCNGNKSMAAKLLKIGRKSFYRS